MNQLPCPPAQTTSATIINVVALVVVVTLLGPASAQVSDLDLPDVMAHAGKVFLLSFQQHPIFGDPRAQTEVSLANGDSLPSWLMFNTTTRSLIGLPFSNVQSPVLLSVTSSCGLKLDDDHPESPASDQTCAPRSDVFQITVTKLSLEHSWTPQPSLASSVLRWSSDSETYHQPPGGDYFCDGDRLIASLVLCVDAGRLRPHDRTALVANLAEFLTIPMMTILLEQSTTHSLVVIEKGFQMVAAGPGTDDLCSLEQILEVLWPLPCSSVKHLVDFVRVLQHNVDGGRLQEELGKGVVGWYIASSNSLQTRQNRKRRAAPNRTLVPTPSIALSKPTIALDSSHHMSDAALTALETTSIPLVTTSSTSTTSIPPAIMSPASISTSSSTSVMSTSSSTSVMSTSSSTSPMSISPSPTASMFMSSSPQVPFVTVSEEPLSEALKSGLPGHASSSLSTSLYDSPSYLSSTQLLTLTQTTESLSGLGLQVTSSFLDRLPLTSLYADELAASAHLPQVASVQSQVRTSALRPSKLVLEHTDASHISMVTFPAVDEVDIMNPSVTTSDSLDNQRSKLTDHKSFQPGHVDTDDGSPHSPPVTVQSVLAPSSPHPYLVQTRTVEIIAPSRVPLYQQRESDLSASLVDSAASQSTNIEPSLTKHDSDLGKLYSEQSLHGSYSASLPLDVTLTSVLLSSRQAVASLPSDLPHSAIDIQDGVTDTGTPRLTHFVTDLHQIKVVTVDSEAETATIRDSLEASNMFVMTTLTPEHSAVFTKVLPESETLSSVYVAVSEITLPETWSHLDSMLVKTSEVLISDTPRPPDSSEVILASSDSSAGGSHVSRSLHIHGAHSEEARDETIVIMDQIISVSSSITKDPHHRTAVRPSAQYVQASSTISQAITDNWSLYSATPSAVLISDTPRPSGSSEVILASSDSSIGESHVTKSLHIHGAHSEEARDETILIQDQIISVSSSITTDPHHRTAVRSSEQYVHASSTISQVSSMTVAFMPVHATAAKVMATSPVSLLPTTPLSTRTTSPKATTARASYSSTTANTTKVTSKKSTPRFYITTTDSARTSDWSDISEAELYNNNRPYVKNPITQIIGERGRVFKFAIPPEVFIDVEDGNTRSLRLSLELTSAQELPTNFWLYLDQGSQVLKGLPLPEDMGNLSVNLVATDSGGLSERTTIPLLINGEGPRDVTHRFNMSFDVDFHQFMRNRRNITNLVSRIGSFFGDGGAKHITVLNVRQGSLRLFWTNHTLSGTACRKDAIMKLYQVLNKTNDLSAHLGQHLKLTQVSYDLLGACSEPPTTTTVTMTTLRVGSTLAPGFNIWAHVILPVMIAFLVFVLIILIIIFCNRRRRHRQAIINAEKEAISNDRNPIIFPDEMDGVDPNLQAKDPLLLPTDPHPANQETPQASPKIDREDDTDGRSRDSRDQEWVDVESRKKGEQKDKPRRHSKDGHRKHHRDKDGRKHSRDKDRMSGVSASSSLSFDRPNNHYLDEEEAGSRNSTLKSNKSGGSEKRHPKQPPPYWQSQSDPPPYRFPPPYLNNTTQV